MAGVAEPFCRSPAEHDTGEGDPRQQVCRMPAREGAKECLGLRAFSLGDERNGQAKLDLRDLRRRTEQLTEDLLRLLRTGSIHQELSQIVPGSEWSGL